VHVLYERADQESTGLRGDFVWLDHHLGKYPAPRSNNVTYRSKDAFKCWLYDDGDSSQSPNNPLRCIMDDGNRTKYFAKMSRAYALQCGGLAMLMTKNPDDIPDDGIWAQAEQPTLERDSDFAPLRQLTSLVRALSLLSCRKWSSC
jgi:hypothetical protein